MVVGILPRTFWFAIPADVLVPLKVTGGIDDQGSNTSVIARMKKDKSIKQAQAELTRLDYTFHKDTESLSSQQDNRTVVTD